MGTIKDILQHPSARLTQHLRLSIGTFNSPLDVVEFEVRQAFNETYTADITVTSTDKVIDGAACVGRRATFTVEERAAIPSVPGLVTPVVEPGFLVHGVVTRWERLKTTRDESTYRLLMEPRVALLDRVHDSGVFHNQSLKDLITELVVDRKLFDAFDIEFALEDAQEQFEQTVMYEESVWNFISRHCRRAGVFWYFRQGQKDDAPRRDTIVFGNNPRAYVRALELPLMPASGLSGNWHEAVLSISEVRTLVPSGVEIWEHNYRTPADPLKAESTVGHNDRSLYGGVNRSTEHHHDAGIGQMLVDARREELVARQTTFRGTSNALGMMPGMVVRLTNHKLPGAGYGVVITKLVTRGSRTQPVTSEFEATPSHLAWRPEYIPEKHWRWITGTLPGIVGMADNQPYASMDEYGRYAVKPQFLRSGARGTSLLLSLRLLRPFASYLGGFHSPLLPDTEVRLAATNGDIDRLHIAGALHDYAHPDLVHGKAGWYSRAVWRSPLLGAKIRLEDLKGHEGVKVATVYMKSSVSLGYLVDNQRRNRGEGFEAVTQAWGTLRAPKGLLLSADPFPDPNAPHLEMRAAMTQLRAALGEAESMRTIAQRATAELAEVKAQQNQLENAFKDLQKAVILLSAPEGIGMVSPKDIQLASGRNITATATTNADFSILKRFTVAAGETISLFAQRAGLKLFAASGKVQVQAQGDAIELAALRNVSITSSNGSVVVAADREILLTSGQGYIRISDGNVEIGCPDAIKQKSAVWSKAGPAGVKTALQGFSKSEGPYNIQYRFSDELGTPQAGMPHLFEIRSDQVTQAAGPVGSTATARSTNSEATRTTLHYSSIKSNQDTDL